MKVAYVVGGLPFGGIERWLYDLLIEYGRTGIIQGRVFNLSGTGSMLPAYLEAGLDVVCVADSIRAIASHRIDTAFALRKELGAFSPDVIHTMHFTANHHGRIAALGLCIPVLMHLHNTKREKKIIRRLSDKLLSYATTKYLAVSKAVAETVAQDHNMAKRPVQVLYNAIEAKRFEVPPVDYATKYGIEGPVVIAVGRYVPQKNLDLLIRSVRILHDQGQRASLVLVGEGSERPKLEALRSELHLEKYVVLTGFREDVAAFYKASHIFAMPSDFEGFLIAQLEAMYCGLPCVVSEFVPILEIAAEASLVCQRDPQNIADNIGAILQDNMLQKRLSSAAKGIAKQFTMDIYAEKLHSLYAEIIRSNGV